MTRGNKAFDIHKNTYRIDADVVPCFEHRPFLGNRLSYSHVDGTELRPDGGGSIINWPKQNYANGVAKNERTSRQFKAVTRMLKRLRYELIDEGYKIAEAIPSYLIECVAWNVPDTLLSVGSAKQNLRSAILHVWDATRTDDDCQEWGEINELKYLFHFSQPWTRANMNTFLETAWNYVGLE